MVLIVVNFAAIVNQSVLLGDTGEDLPDVRRQLLG
jgi:hypothetical protein